jgi:hypothetical protein
MSRYDTRLPRKDDLTQNVGIVEGTRSRQEVIACLVDTDLEVM